jgi:hypothetical protein
VTRSPYEVLFSFYLHVVVHQTEDIIVIIHHIRKDGEK